MKIKHAISKLTGNFVLIMLLTVSVSNLTWATISTGDNPVQVYHIQNFFTEAYLVKGNSNKLILIDTGINSYENDLVASIKKLGFDPKDISLAIVTHGHGDHAGNARFLQENYHVTVAGSKFDMDKFTRGKSDLSKSASIGVWGDRFRSVSDLDYKPFTPDIIIENKEIDLSKYGIKGKIIPMPGHTPGSLLIQFGDKLFVGDLFCATFKMQGQAPVPDGHHARQHFFHENYDKVKEQLKLVDKFVVDNHIETLYPIHFGEVSAYEFRKFVREEPLLTELSELQTKVLKEIVQKKSDLVKKYMANDAALIPVHGIQLTKDMFIKGFIENPDVYIESIAPEDFRIVYSDDHTAIMNYKEQIKLASMEQPLMALVTISYAKIKGTWMVVNVQSTQIQS